MPHRRIYDMRHTFATWSLAAGMSILRLARRMGTSVQTIDATYGHLAHDADDQDRILLDANDTLQATNGHTGHRDGGVMAPGDEETPPERGFVVMGAAGFEPATSRV